ncbi:amylo-alpha-1,6-glucosidase [Candidatus Contendibacter odensensis]|uniref:Amylo-alpha-16-glucosidase n=1 Tax=Candidatus Contendobacter odensis Run_B_J11 TaxID=1400861 RepID=A0A7U7J2A3_9GAMM|nr:amylo-alpha-1,6-glucosidase [Candidatus Contendobacter odensis]CDH44865.1 Amylo-alpha-16-glucosidase [Candidatus Contendobacter odensis Run_B_J11]
MSSVPDFIRFGRAICGDLDQAERHEWWLSNGLGGYAAGTVAGTLTRCYHGLLIAPVYPPLGRWLVFAKADATLLDGGRETPLFSNRWGGGIVNPTGHVYLESFQLHGRMPVWRYALGDRVIEQRIWLEPGANTVYIAWRLDTPAADRDLQLRVRLLINARDHHARMAPGGFTPQVNMAGEQLHVVCPDQFALRFQAAGGVLQPEWDWIENFDLLVERERGLPERDAHLCIGQAMLTLRPGVWVGVVASLRADADTDLDAALQRFFSREAMLLDCARPYLTDPLPDWIAQLTLAADSFLFARPLPDWPNGESVIAGYPWFGDWGRDTMIALPGLTLSTGRADSARRILLTFARFVDQGMLPNVFPGAVETPDYNTVDAALWYFEAWRAYVEATDDQAALAKVFPVLADMIDWHVRGTRYHIGMDAADGLLYTGEPGVQLTWMDAKVGDWVVTPRIGKPVEINALWYNALASMADFAEQLGQPADRYSALAAQVRHGFQRFVRPADAGLADLLDGPAGDDFTLRPNQIFAVSLPHSPLDPATQRTVVQVCGRELLTSYGLRSLAPNHLDYRPHYLGGVWERDGSYHQGPVWGWLLGHYALAEYRVYGDAAVAQTRLTPIRDHLLDAGLGTISEIFDGAPPHAPRGAPAQAWSVACVLEAWQRLERLRLNMDSRRLSTVRPAGDQGLH